jgi:plastocyanin
VGFCFRSLTRTGLAGGAVSLCLTFGACTTSPATGTSAGHAAAASSGPPSGPASASQSALTINITIANGKVDPNGEKINVSVGQQVTLDVTSDQDDEIHAHTGGDGYELEVKAGQPTTGTFTVPTPGSFEVESHHLEKIIVILNAR